MINYESIYDQNISIFSAIYKYLAENNKNKLSKIFSENPELLNVPIYGGVGGNRSLLHQAADDGSLDICELLIELGIDVNISDDSGLTPLFEAATNGRLDIVNFLLAKGAKIDGSSSGITTPLIAAVRYGHIELVKLFLSKGADINRLQANFNQTALDTARIYKQKDIERLLLEKGAQSAHEVIDLAKEPASGILERVYEKVGPILSTKIKTDFAVIRTALVEKGNKFKLLFTIGNYILSPRVELMMVLPYNWPVNQALLKENNVTAFPINILALLSEKMQQGLTLAEGSIIDKDMLSLDKSIWPDTMDALVAVDYQFSREESTGEIYQDEVTLLMLVPIKYPKAGKLSDKKMTDWIAKQRISKWNKIVLK